MEDDEREDRGVLGGLADKVKNVVNDPALKEGLMNQAAAMPGAGGDLNQAAQSPASGPAGMMPGAGAAAAGSLTDEEPVGTVDEERF